MSQSVKLYTNISSISLTFNLSTLDVIFISKKCSYHHKKNQNLSSWNYYKADLKIRAIRRLYGQKLDMQTYSSLPYQVYQSEKIKHPSITL